MKVFRPSHVLLLFLLFFLNSCNERNLPAQSEDDGISSSKISLKEFQDKMRGAWAGQVIGVTYGFPVEFRYNSVMVPDSVELAWADTTVKVAYRYHPGAYDDIYVDLTFLEVYNKNINATAANYGEAFKNTTYDLWFANQVARNNLKNGLSAREAGHWKHNPECTSIDFQIEADFIGLLYPGMHQEAIALADSVGHIMGYGDGYYGGVFISQMYAAAFTTQDIDELIQKGLAPIPPEALFHQMITDVVDFHEANPENWKSCWKYINDKYQDENGSPFGVEDGWNIEASMNSCHVVTGLLYGEGDFEQSIEIATRCGNDADCNPGTAAGLLGAMYGYDWIPEKYKKPLAHVKDETFLGTTITMNDAIAMTEKLALVNLGFEKDSVEIPTENKAPMCALEVARPHHNPFKRTDLEHDLMNEPYEMTFEGNGIAFFSILTENKTGIESRTSADSAFVDVFIDGAFEETIAYPLNFLDRRFVSYYKYLKSGEHKVKFVPKQAIEGYTHRLYREIQYQDPQNETSS